jgi:hypothetical protein
MYFNSSFTQEKKVNNPLQEQDLALLDIITADSINPLNIQLNSDIFNFGLDTKTFKDIALVKKGKDVWLQPLGTGRLYKLEKSKSNYSLIRIDSTIHSGVNYKALHYIYRCPEHQNWTQKTKQFYYNHVNTLKPQVTALSKLCM